MKTYINKIALFIIAISSQLSAQEVSLPKYEMRAAWIATVANIDWPSKSGLSVRKQKIEYVNILDSLEAVNMNAVVMQIRPQADAFYNSKYEPWSQFLSGRQGEAPGDSLTFYDPLQFMLEETHKRGMEFHAWLNPYRINIFEDTSNLDSNHVYFKHPEWFVKYGTRYYFNPGVKESEDFVIGVIEDILKKYDVDAIHFDDYFYPYEIANTPFPDSLQYHNYLVKHDSLHKEFESLKHQNDSLSLTESVKKGLFADLSVFPEAMSLQDWRRDNVNRLVENICITIKEKKPWVQFGISPFGVWRNKSADPKGSDTKAGQTNYDNLYADVLLWMENGWLDYVTPQIYWRIGHPAADFTTILNWWNDLKTDTRTYIGQGVYRIESDSKYPEWKNYEGYSKQINLIRKSEKAKGSMHFSAKAFINNSENVNTSLKNRDYRKPAIIPPFEGTFQNENIIDEIKVSGSWKKGVKISWENLDDNTLRYYLIYRFRGDKVGDLSNPENIIAKVSSNYSKELSFLDEDVKLWKRYTYVITSVNRFNNESKGSEKVLKVRIKRIKE